MTRSRAKSITKSLELTKLAETRWGPKRHWHCVYCGRGAGIMVDHFIPSSQGGTDDVWNLLPVCSRCNSVKMDKPPHAWMEAVGVPRDRRRMIDAVTHLSDWVAPSRLQIRRLALDYHAGGAIPRPKKLRQGA